MTNIYLIRHGTTDSNKSGKFQGTLDTPLNELGLAQAEKLGERFQNVKLDAVYASNLSRAIQTAEVIARVAGLHPIIMPELAEINLGKMEGKTAAENAEIYGEIVDALKSNPAGFCAPDGESARDVYDRMRDAIGKIVEQNPGKDIAVVSHGYAIQMYMHFASGEDFSQVRSRIVGNTAVCKFVFDEQPLPQTQYINDQSHLPKELEFDAFADDVSKKI